MKARGASRCPYPTEGCFLAEKLPGETQSTPAKGLARSWSCMSQSALGIVEREERRLDLGTACL